MLSASASDSDAALFTLHSTSDGKASTVTGVCFVTGPTLRPVHHVVTADGKGGVSAQSIVDRHGDRSSSSDDSEDNDDESSEEDSDPLHFRCSDLLLGPSRRHGDAARASAASHASLSGAVLASCHLDGACKLWDLAARRCVAEDIVAVEDPRRRSAGLALRRLDRGPGEFLYQTRDPAGTVTIHDAARPRAPLLRLHTGSSSFCAAAPCRAKTGAGGAGNLVALPTAEHSVAVVRDLRCDPQGAPARRVSVGGAYFDTGRYGSRRGHGMLMSLALCEQDATGRVVLGCGMEDGAAVFYDLGAAGDVADAAAAAKGASDHTITDADARNMCHAKLGKDPVLCLDLSSSIARAPRPLAGGRDAIGDAAKTGEATERPPQNSVASLVAVAGCAGDVDVVAELPEPERGTISTLRVKLAADFRANAGGAPAMSATLRAKTATCSLDSGGKVGVSVCRFRPDGRLFAAGGWDRRLRLFGRTSSKPLAVLRGHEDSVAAVDWADDAAASGLLATGAGDGRICVWRAFPHSAKKSTRRDGAGRGVGE